MKSKDIFAIAVRLLGLVFVYHGLMAVMPAVALFFQVFREPASGLIYGPLMVAWPLLVAQWLLRGAPMLMDIAYPEPPSQPAGIPVVEKAGA